MILPVYFPFCFRPERYNFLARSVKGGVAMSVVKRLVLDQFAFAPIFIAFMLATMLYLEGRGDDVTRHLEDNWASTLVQYVMGEDGGAKRRLHVGQSHNHMCECATPFSDSLSLSPFCHFVFRNWKVWIPAQLINFAFVPPLYQVRQSHTETLPPKRH